MPWQACINEIIPEEPCSVRRTWVQGSSEQAQCNRRPCNPVHLPPIPESTPPTPVTHDHPNPTNSMINIINGEKTFWALIALVSLFLISSKIVWAWYELYCRNVLSIPHLAQTLSMNKSLIWIYLQAFVHKKLQVHANFFFRNQKQNSCEMLWLSTRR